MKKISTIVLNYAMLAGFSLHFFVLFVVLGTEIALDILWISVPIGAWQLFLCYILKEIEFDDKRVSVLSFWGNPKEYSMNEVVGLRRHFQTYHRIRVWDNGQVKSFYFLAKAGENGLPPLVEELEYIVKAREADNRKRLGLE